MKTEVFSGTVGAAYGKELDEKVAFNGSYEAYENFDEVPADEKPDASELLLVVNNKRKASARSKATLLALEAAGITKPEIDPKEKARNIMVKTLSKLHGISEEEAGTIVDSMSAALAK